MFNKKIHSGLLALTAAISFNANAEPPSRDYIVMLNDNAGQPEWVAQQVAANHGGRVGYVYQTVIQGFSITLPEKAAEAIARRSDVAFVEPDMPVSIIAQSTPTGIDRAFASANSTLDIDGTDDYRVDADVAVLDTGIDLEHPDLNVVGGANCLASTGKGPRWSRTYYCDENLSYDDDHYHGTHVAGTIGALDNGYGVVGIAPGTRLWSLKVLDSSGSGYTSGIVAGIDWVVANGNIEVLNMSLGGSGVSETYKTAIDNAVANGVVVVVAAGNDDQDANNFSPAYVPSAITVSALADFDGQAGGLGAPTCRTDEDDTLANFSNWGSAVDIAAPGACILSTFPLEQGEYASISGTSMASPHVAGAAALLASGTNAPTDASDVQAIRDALVNNGNFNWTDDSTDNIQEALLDLSNSSVFSPTLVATGNNGGGNSAPSADFSFSCNELSCTFDATSSSDIDGSIVSYSWNFGDGNGASGATTSHTFASANTYSVTLTVEDDAAATDSQSQQVTVSEASTGGIELSATGYKVKGQQKADLSWSGAFSSSVDIYRDGTVINTVANTGSYTDHINRKGGGSYTYNVCEAGTSTCSDAAVIVF